MLEGLNTAAAGMAAQQQRLDAVANDLANANTTGYKHQRVGFRDLVYTQAGRSSATGVATGAGAAAVDAGRSFGQGVLQRTDRPLDVAIQG
jgi:flagellar basal-body rod protein FlgG